MGQDEFLNLGDGTRVGSEKMISESTNNNMRNSKNKRMSFAKGVLFWLLLVMLLNRLQEVMITRWNYPDASENMYNQIDAILSQDKDIEQVLFLGTSHIQRGISPMLLYQENGIVSYNLGTSMQTIECSYYMLKSVLKKQTPEVVVLDASNLFFRDNGTYRELDLGLRYVIDSMPLSSEKISLSKEYASMKLGKTDMQDTTSNTHQRFLNCLFPLIQYHSRWNEMSINDFVFAFRKPGWHYAGGYNFDSAINVGRVTIEQMNTEANFLVANDKAHVITYEKGKRIESQKKESNNRNSIPKENLDWLRKIQSLCKENGAELLLVKIPCVKSVTLNESAWTESRSEVVKQLSAELGVSFIDYVYDMDIGYDLGTDTPDGGGHLNYNGVKKVTAAMGDYLKTHYRLSKTTCEVYNESLKMYNKIANIVELELSTDLIDYCSKLSMNSDNYLILMSVESDMKLNLSDNQIKALSALELRTDFVNEMKQDDSWLAVIDGGKVLYESISNHELSYSYTTDKGLDIKVKSVGHYARSGGGRQEVFDVDGLMYYGLRGKGLNIMVIDKPSGEIIDYVNFDTSEFPNASATRGKTNERTVQDYLKSYELWYTLHPNELHR